MTTTTAQTLNSVCDICDGPITITLSTGQRWSDVTWEHVSDGDNVGHDPQPELRFAIDATCPGCDYPEIGYAPARAEFVCSRCGFTSETRPES